MKTADIIKSAMITKRAYKGSLIVEEVGLPIDKDWTKSLRADLMEVTKENRLIIYEVKSSMADYRSDNKWQGYLKHCELLYFIAPTKVAKVIKEETPSNVGVYATNEFGYSQCLRSARKTDHKPNIEDVKEKLQIQLAYRYAKIHSNKVKAFKKKQND